MNMRPFNPVTCINNQFCNNCPDRVGCLMRYYFYNGDDFDQEIILQKTEINAQEFMSEDDAFNNVDIIRKKRNRELSEHHFFSFT